MAETDEEWDETDGGSHTTCWAGVCCWDNPEIGTCRHPCCENCLSEEQQDEEPQDQLTTLISAVDEADWGAVRRLVADYPERVSVNVARRSVQATSACRPNEYIVNLPVPSEVITYLSQGLGTEGSSRSPSTLSSR